MTPRTNLNDSPSRAVGVRLMREVALGACLTLATTGVAVGLERVLNPAHLGLVFVAPVVLAAIWFGVSASVAVAFMCVLAINYLFVEPRYTFNIARSQDLWALAVFVLVALVTSAAAARARGAKLAAQMRARQSEVLREYARSLAAARDVPEIVAATTLTLREISGREADCLSASADESSTDPEKLHAARWAMSTKTPTRSEAAGAYGKPWRFWPVIVSGRSEWAIGLNDDSTMPADIEVVVEQVSAHVGVALERVRQSEIADAARFDVEKERLKAVLLAGVSHDLRTPLSTMILSLESLRVFGDAHDATARSELLGLVEDEARRLSAMVENLLAASRIERGAEPVKSTNVALSVLLECLRPMSNLVIDRASIERLPDVAGDVALAERALVNVLENASKYAGDGKIVLRGVLDNYRAGLIVEDEGPGLGINPEQMLKAFVRGKSNDGRSPGLGLGLSVARTYQEAQGGELEAENRDDASGARLTLWFKLSEI